MASRSKMILGTAFKEEELPSKKNERKETVAKNQSNATTNIEWHLADEYVLINQWAIFLLLAQTRLLSFPADVLEVARRK